MNSYPLLSKLVRVTIPKGIKEKRDSHFEFARQITLKRVHRQDVVDRGDFMDYMLKKKGDVDALTEDELVATANVLIIAGSETTATLPSGITYWLLKTPAVLAKVSEEVRAAFKSDEEIDFVSAKVKLPYMLACLDEALRMYPPVASAIPRRVPPRVASVHVDGYEFPTGTVLSVHHSASYWSPLNFTQPRSFIPERWLPAAINDPSSPFHKDNRDVLQPFSIGPRNCIGKNLAYNEMRVILAKVLWNFDLELCAESEDWANQKTFGVLWEKPELMCILRQRPIRHTT